MKNALTIDVEDYWSIFYRDWLKQPLAPTDRVVKNTHWFLERLEQVQVTATFFVLGDVAKHYPQLIREISSAGHEIGSHGISHKQIFRLSKESLKQELVTSKKMLEDCAGTAVLGYRAPAFSVRPDTEWALEVIAEAGFKYDSSIYPIQGKRYGWPGFSPDIHSLELKSGRILIEVPMSTIKLLGRTIPAAGGGYLRHFPYAFTRYCIRQINKKRPAIIYMHPYEQDVLDRELDYSRLSSEERKNTQKFHRMQKRNRQSTPAKLKKLCHDFELTNIASILEAKGLLQSQPTAA